jgi:tubulin delta
MTAFIQIGQCGNQLGERLMLDLFNESQRQTKPSNQPTDYQESPFFHLKSQKDKCEVIANSLAIDMEPKVIEAILNKKGKQGFNYASELSFTKQEGSGNNWAYGYNHHGPMIEHEIADRFQKLAERMDDLSSVVLLQSMGGGTGSGVGSYILSILKELYPELFYVNFMVMPKLAGEVILQYYNAVFSLTSVYENSDAVFIFENDKADLICKDLLFEKTVNLDSMNGVLSKFCASALLANKSAGYGFQDIIAEYLTPLPSAKLLGSRFIPLVREENKGFLADTWNGLLFRAQQMLMSGSTECNINWQVRLRPQKQPANPISIPAKSHQETANNYRSVARRSDSLQRPLRSETLRIEERAKSKDLRIQTQSFKNPHRIVPDQNTLPDKPQKPSKLLGAYLELNSAKNDVTDELLTHEELCFSDAEWYHSDLIKPIFDWKYSRVKRAVEYVRLLPQCVPALKLPRVQ